MSTDLNLAEIKAEEIAKKYNPSGLSPFPFDQILTDHTDVNIFTFDSDEKISGAILYDPKTSKFRILINPSKPPTRQQFTIAHELGHYFLHFDIVKSGDGFIDADGNLDGGNILYRLDKPQSTSMEAEANRFAAALIMPKQLVDKAWTELKNVEACANIFNVSVSAMSIRLERLGLLIQ